MIVNEETRVGLFRFDLKLSWTLVRSHIIPKFDTWGHHFFKKDWVKMRNSGLGNHYTCEIKAAQPLKNDAWKTSPLSCVARYVTVHGAFAVKLRGCIFRFQRLNLGCSKQVLWFDVHGPSMFLIRDFISQNKNVDREHQLFAHVLETGHFCWK